MARIDCRITVNFLKEWRRMCLAERAKCNDECPFSICENGEGLGCDVFVQKHPKAAVEIVQKWSDAHPVKTRLDDLLERCPNVPLDGDGFPCFSPSMLGYCGDCVGCRNWKNPDVRNCWNEPVDGGATGKAVE